MEHIFSGDIFREVFSMIFKKWYVLGLIKGNKIIAQRLIFNYSETLQLIKINSINSCLVDFQFSRSELLVCYAQSSLVEQTWKEISRQ